MSYCHMADVGINLTKGFGPQPKALIISRINNAECLAPCAGCLHYPDVDGDGRGDSAVDPIYDCENIPAGTVTNANDCDDNDDAIWIGLACDATPGCDNAFINNECECEDRLTTYYTDADGDGFGDPDTAADECT